MYFSASHKNSSFDVAISGTVQPFETQHNIENLGEIIRFVKPGGKILIQEAVTQQTNGPQEDKMVSLLKMSGFIDIEKVTCLQFISFNAYRLTRDLPMAYSFL